ncbi:MAG: dienelactone hydrolase family protein [Bdellovibrionales bacterium]|nr:dienelactone hydrolase family protein [Bdellovibrionales bacterium]
MNRTKMASLDTIEVTPGGFSAAADGSAARKGAVVLFHGYGADNKDLASLASAVGSPADVSWYFPNGPHSVPIGPHMSGRAWFPLRLADLEAQGLDFTQTMPEGMGRAVEGALKAVEDLRVQKKLEWNQIVLGGFSQGAMIALEVALRAPKACAGVTLFSGSLVNEPALAEAAKKKKGLRFFQSHGIQDPVLPFELAEKLDATLNEAGLDGMLYSFRGGHEIPLPVLREWASWLKSAPFFSTK